MTQPEVHWNFYVNWLVEIITELSTLHQRIQYMTWRKYGCQVLWNHVIFGITELIERNPFPRGVFLFTMFPDCVPWGFLFAGKETPTEHSITKYIRSIQTNLTFKLLWNDALEFLDSGGFLCSMVAYKSTPTAPLLMWIDMQRATCTRHYFHPEESNLEP